MSEKETPETPKATKAKKKKYTVLTGVSPYEKVHEGEYETAAQAFAAAIASTKLGDGESVKYVVVASKFLRPRTAKVAVERRVVLS